MLDDMPIDHAELDRRKAQFDEFGYLILQDVLPPELVAELLVVIEELRPTLAQHSRGSAGLSIRPIIDKHPAFEKLLMWSGSFPTVVRLLEHYNIQLMQSNLIEAPPSDELRKTGWHSDGGLPSIAVNGIRAFGSLKVGYFLRDVAGADSGALMVVPGSHRIQGAPPFPAGARDPVGAVAVELTAGSAVVFHQGLWHAAAPNHSATTRVALYYGYGYRMLRPVDYFRMPEHVLRDCTPVQRQLLGETVTHEGYYVPTDEDTPLRAWYEANFGAPENRGELERVAQVQLD